MAKNEMFVQLAKISWEEYRFVLIGLLHLLLFTILNNNMKSYFSVPHIAAL